MYDIICGNKQFSSEICHLVYLELGFNFQNSVSKSYQSLRPQISHAPCVYAAPYYCPADKQ